MLLHSSVWVLSRFKCDWYIAHWTIWCYTIMLGLIIFRALVRIDFEMFLAERILAIVAFERQKVDEQATDVCTLLSYTE